MNWKNYIIVLISFGIGFLIGWHPATESVRNYVIDVVIPLVLSGGGFALVFKLWDWVEEQNTKKKKNKLAHSNKLLDNLRRMAETTIDFKDSTDDLCIQINNLPNTQEYKMYSNDVDAHLKSGYYHIVWKQIEKRESDIIQHNIDLQKFSKQLISDIVSSIKQRIPVEWNNYNPTDSRKYFVETNIESDLFKAIRSNYGTYEYFRILISGDSLAYNLNYKDGSIWVVSDEKEQIKEIKKAIESIFNVDIKDKQFTVLKNQFKSLKENDHSYIIREMGNIIKDLESGTPLKGKCGIAGCGGKR